MGGLCGLGSYWRTRCRLEAKHKLPSVDFIETGAKQQNQSRKKTFGICHESSTFLSFFASARATTRRCCCLKKKVIFSHCRVHTLLRSSTLCMCYWNSLLLADPPETSVQEVESIQLCIVERSLFATKPSFSGGNASALVCLQTKPLANETVAFGRSEGQGFIEKHAE